MSVAKNRLSGMRYDEVSLVDGGANQDSHVALFKRDTPAGTRNSADSSLSSGKERPIRKERRLMATEVIEKRKGGLTCGDCGNDIAPNEASCPDCGSSHIKKSIVIVRKEISEVDETDSDQSGDTDLTEEELQAIADSLDEETDDDDDESDESDINNDEDDDNTGADFNSKTEPTVAKSLTPSEQGTIAVEALSLAADLATNIAKMFDSGVTKSTSGEYEELMTDFNAAIDDSFSSWVGKGFTGDREISKKAGVVRQQITEIIKSASEGGNMPEITRPAALDGLDLPADVAGYVDTLEKAAGVEKVDIFKGLSPEVTEIVKQAQKTNENALVAKWNDVAEKFDAVPGDKVELAKSLRALHTADPAGYEALVKSLEGANAAAKSADITKSWGKPGGGESTSDIEKRESEARELVEKGQYPTIEQAQVALMALNPKSYDGSTK